MPFFRKKPQIILVTQYAPVHEKIVATYGNDFQIRIAKTESELQKIRLKQSNIKAVFYDAITSEQEDVIDFIESYNRKPTEGLILILAEQKLKEDNDFKYLDQLFELVDADSLDDVISFKKENTFPKNVDLMSLDFDEMTRDEYEKRFAKVYSKRKEEVVPNVESVPDLPVVIETTQKQSLDTVNNEGHQTTVGGQNFALPNGDELTNLLKNQLSSSQNVPTSKSANELYKGNNVQKEELQRQESHAPSIKNLEEENTLNSDLPQLSQEKQADLIAALKESEKYGKETYALAIEKSEANDLLTIENNRLKSELSQIQSGGVGKQIATFLSTFETQQKQLQELKESINASSLKEIENLNKENLEVKQVAQDFKRKWRDERAKSSELVIERNQALEEKKEVSLELEENQEELQRYRAIVQQFQTFQTQFATMFNVGDANNKSFIQSKPQPKVANDTQKLKDNRNNHPNPNRISDEQTPQKSFLKEENNE